MPLTESQYLTLADILTGTTKAATDVAREMFGYKWTDDDFDTLRWDFDLFRCHECDKWLDASYESDLSDVRADCAEEAT